MRVRGVPVRDEGGVVREWVGVSADVTGERDADVIARVRARQQLQAADLGRLALSGVELDTLFGEALEAVAQTLGADVTVALELAAGGEELAVHAAHGWQDAPIGTGTTRSARSLAGLTLSADGPVVVDDIAADARFEASPLLRATGAVSALAVKIRGREPAWGVLGALSRSQRRFDLDDASFLRTVANILAAAIVRRGREESLAFLADASEALSSSLDYERTLAEVAKLAVPRLADCCIVDVLEERRSVHQLAVVHVDAMHGTARSRARGSVPLRSGRPQLRRARPGRPTSAIRRLMSTTRSSATSHRTRSTSTPSAGWGSSRLSSRP